MIKRLDNIYIPLWILVRALLNEELLSTASASQLNTLRIFATAFQIRKRSPFEISKLRAHVCTFARVLFWCSPKGVRKRQRDKVKEKEEKR